MNLQALLEGMAKIGASDLHLKVGSPPMFRVTGALKPVDHPILVPKDTEDAMLEITPGKKRQIFDEIGTADFAYSIPKVARFRINIFHQRGSISLAIRQINISIPTVESLNIPEVVNTIADSRKGLILVTGVTGSGKSSTLAAMINRINQTRRDHIITIEDPIEFLHKDKMCIINQMELGVDTQSFAIALKHVLRQDPDIIMVGEMRDRDTVKTALTAIETGHMVFGTLHTPDARQSINRILHFFAAEDERLILEQLALDLNAVISQRLLRSVDGKERVPACEILINTPIVSKLIRESNIADIRQAIQNKEEGMQTFGQALVELVQKKSITMEEGLKYCDDEQAFRRQVEGRYAEGERAAIIGSM